MNEENAQQEPDDENPLSQLVEEIKRDRVRLRQLPIDPLICQQLDLTVMSYIEELAKHARDLTDAVYELVEAADDDGAPPLDPEFVSMIVQLAGVAEGLATEWMQLSELIHGVSTLQEVKSKAGKLEKARDTLSQVTVLARNVLTRLAELAEAPEEEGEEEGSEDQDEQEAPDGAEPAVS